MSRYREPDRRRTGAGTHIHLCTQRKGSYWWLGPGGEGPQMGLEIVSSLRQVCRALIGCWSIWPLTFYNKWPQQLRQREISHQVLFSERIPCTDLCCWINEKAIGEKNTLTTTDILGFVWYFAVIFIVLFSFLSAVCADKNRISQKCMGLIVAFY